MSSCRVASQRVGVILSQLKMKEFSGRANFKASASQIQNKFFFCRKTRWLSIVYGFHSMFILAYKCPTQNSEVNFLYEHLGFTDTIRHCVCEETELG